jgi:uncharacterized protein (DUF2267 family)
MNKLPLGHPSELEEPPELAEALDVARAWIADLMARLQWRERATAFRVLVAGLHGLRDSLSRDAAAQLGAALPPLLRGYYFAGWLPSPRSASAGTRAGFLARIHEGVRRDPAVDPEQAARAVLELIADRLSATDVENARSATPRQLRPFWPD